MTQDGSGLRRRDLAALVGLALPGIGTAQAQQLPRPRLPPGNQRERVHHLPAMPCADRPGDIVGLLLEGSGAPAGTVVVFGQAFRPGDVPRGAALAARLAADGRAVPVQLDVTRRHQDGSARHAVVSLAAPALPNGQRAGVVLSRREPGGIAAAPLDLAALLEGREVIVELAPPGGGAPWRADLAALLRAAPAAGRWQSGPLAVQTRLALPAPLGDVRSLRVLADIAVRADRSIWVDLWMRNDIAQQPDGGEVAYTVRLAIDRRDALAQEVPKHWQYSGWGRLVGGTAGGAPAPVPARVIHDAGYLGSFGAVMPYDLSVGVAQIVFDLMAWHKSFPGWDTPLGARGLQTSMGAAGGRPDLGQTTNWIAAWLVSGDARAEEFSLGQAEAAGGIPWHLWDPRGGAGGTGGWLDVKRWPMLWSDRRGTPPRHGLVQPVPRDSIWGNGATPSHQPALSYVPYLLTARRAFLDNLTAQAAWNVVTVWPDARRRAGPVGGLPDANVVNARQTRSTAWTMRTLEEAAWISPDDDPTLPYIEQVTAGNWAWIRAQLPGWTETQGAVHGYIVPLNYGYIDHITPWQQDYFVTSAAMSALRGREDARAVLDWMRNFIVGRFFATEHGFTRNDAVALTVGVVPRPVPTPPLPPARPYRSWAEVAAAGNERGISNGDGWRNSNGEYPRLGLMSLGLVAHVFNDERAKEAWNWLANSDANAARVEIVARSPYHNVAPPGVARVRDHAPRCTASAAPRG